MASPKSASVLSETNGLQHVDCPGEVLNNQPPFDSNAHRYCAGRAADQKTQFLKQYKFTIAFENESAPNYTTEKIFHAFVAGSIPDILGKSERCKPLQSEELY